MSEPERQARGGAFPRLALGLRHGRKKIPPAWGKRVARGVQFEGLGEGSVGVRKSLAFEFFVRILPQESGGEPCGKIHFSAVGVAAIFSFALHLLGLIQSRGSRATAVPIVGPIDA